MRIDVTQELTDLLGNVLVERKQDGEAETVTLRAVCVTALMGESDKDAPQAKYDNFHLAKTMMDNDVVDLKAEQVAMLKDRIGKRFPTLYMAQAWDMLDPPGGM